MNLYKYHTNPEILLYNEEEVMMRRFKEWFYSREVYGYRTGDADHDSYLDIQRQSDFEEWFLNGKSNPEKDLYIDYYIEIMGLEYDDVRHEFRPDNSEEWEWNWE